MDLGQVDTKAYIHVYTHTHIHPYLGGQWFLMDESLGSFKHVSLVFRCLVDRLHVHNRVDMIIVGGRAKWEIQDCSLWVSWGGVVSCMESAFLSISNSVLSGTGSGDLRSVTGVTAFDASRVGLRRCLIQQVSGVGARFYDEAECVLSNCTLRLCEVALSLEQQSKVLVDQSLFEENQGANFMSSQDASTARLKILKVII
jgi:hypothetical protein